MVSVITVELKLKNWMNMSNINTDGMISAAETFRDAYEHVLGNLVADTKERTIKFVMEIVLRQKPYMMVSKEGLPKIMDVVFSSDEIRDFIFTLHFVFFSRWGNEDQDVNGLIGNLARGAGLASFGKLNAIPVPINDRLTGVDDVNQILMDNKWLTIILMLQMFVVLDKELLNPKPNK
jgi:hypothetical protein